MTEIELRNKVVACARSWLGRREVDGSHRAIIDVYNTIRPLPGGYKMTYTDPWCAAFVSAVGQACHLADIIYPECSCERMIALYRQHGRWVEDDSYTPTIGDLVMYDWQDSGVGDDTGEADHVGIVTSVYNAEIVVIEGNKSDMVAYRTIRQNGRYIRGYCCPDYLSKVNDEPDPEPTPTPEPTPAPEPEVNYFPYVYRVGVNLLKPGNRGPQVKQVQILLIAHNFYTGAVSGIYDDATTEAVRKFQTAAGLLADGEFGGLTFTKLWNWG